MDLNSDLGESFGAWLMGHDARLMPAITSANIACGFHAGDPGTMRATIALAAAHHVAIGAHPGFPDLAGYQFQPSEVAAGGDIAWQPASTIEKIPIQSHLTNWDSLSIS